MEDVRVASKKMMVYWQTYITINMNKYSEKLICNNHIYINILIVGLISWNLAQCISDNTMHILVCQTLTKYYT